MRNTPNAPRSTVTRWIANWAAKGDRISFPEGNGLSIRAARADRGALVRGGAPCGSCGRGAGHGRITKRVAKRRHQGISSQLVRKSKFGAKTTFILSRPTTEPAGEIVAAGAALGLHFHPIYVHTVRLRARKLALRGPRQRGPSKSAPREVVPKGVSSTVHPEGQRKKAHHAQFVSLALEIGFVRAAELLEKVRAHVSAWSQKVKS